MLSDEIARYVLCVCVSTYKRLAAEKGSVTYSRVRTVHASKALFVWPGMVQGQVHALSLQSLIALHKSPVFIHVQKEAPLGE